MERRDHRRKLRAHFSKLVVGLSYLTKVASFLMMLAVKCENNS